MNFNAPTASGTVMPIGTSAFPSAWSSLVSTPSVSVEIAHEVIVTIEGGHRLCGSLCRDNPECEVIVEDFSGCNQQDLCAALVQLLVGDVVAGRVFECTIISAVFFLSRFTTPFNDWSNIRDGAPLASIIYIVLRRVANHTVQQRIDRHVQCYGRKHKHRKLHKHHNHNDESQQQY